MKRDIIVYLPYSYMRDYSNEYTHNMMSVIKKEYKIKGRLCSPLNRQSMLKTKAVILNWVENKLNERMKEQLLSYRNNGAKIIWFFHNKTAHDKSLSEVSGKNISWLMDNSDCIALLTPGSIQYVPDQYRCKTRLVPHIAYKNNSNAFIKSAIKEKYSINDNNICLCLIGTIQPYKNIEYAIQAFKSIPDANARLIIAGNPVNNEYKSEIRNMIYDDDRIISDFRFLLNEELDGVIDISNAVLMCHSEKSSINSGVLIKALSLGKVVIAPNICMVEDIPADKSFVFRWELDDLDSLKDQMQSVMKCDKDCLISIGIQGKEYIEENNSNDIVAKAIFDILNEYKMNANININDSSFEIEQLDYENEKFFDEVNRLQFKINTMRKMLTLKNRSEILKKWLEVHKFHRIAIYGYGDIGKILYEDMLRENIFVSCIIDKNAYCIDTEIPAISLDEQLPETDLIIITVDLSYDEIKSIVQSKASIPVISFNKILNQLIIMQ